MNNISSGIKTALFTTFFIFLFLYLFTRVLGPIPFSVNSINTTKTDMFTVTGEGEANAVPDTALANFGVTKNGSTVEVAKNQVNEVAGALIAGLKNLGIDERKIKTTNFSINPDYDYRNGTQNIIGYSVTQNLQVEITPIEKANQAIDMATKNGANMIGSIQFTVADEKRTALENKAREDAIKKAKEKAQNIANAAGIRLGKLINVMESSPAYRPYVSFDMMKAAGSAENSAPTELQPGESSTRVSVTLYYETF